MTDSTFFEQEHRALMAQVDSFVNAEIEPRSAEQPDYIAQAFDFIRRMAAQGLLRYVVPQAYGGVHAALDIRSLCLIRRGLARYSSLADTMFAMQGLGSYPITLAGSEKLKRQFLPKIASGEAIAAFAITEPD